MIISEMTDAELDRAIAEKRGTRGDYKFYQKGSQVMFGRGIRNNNTEHITTIEDLWIDSKGNCSVADPLIVYPFTTDPRYAMELLKEMMETGNTMVIFKEGKKYTFDGEADNCVGVADTPERAIAEAYALMTEGE